MWNNITLFEKCSYQSNIQINTTYWLYLKYINVNIKLYIYTMLYKCIVN